MLALIEMKIRLSEAFDMVDLGEASLLLGIQIVRDRSKREIRLNA